MLVKLLKKTKQKLRQELNLLQWIQLQQEATRETEIEIVPKTFRVHVFQWRQPQFLSLVKLTIEEKWRLNGELRVGT